ncbi:MAG: zinc-binding dehydrogenase [Deltaproteobacteria bacterium]|jgi:NADPH:quinone reductase-like Zn-dependent oxidoreductase|nr:zinc-binding dehydrogenase [Deltaproteobacteria bacterium]MDA8308547.1 zinc-binding dehydrogenase [Deltaproteobacteria bacterium]
MKALCFYQHGDLDVLRYDDVADPVPGSGEVLVEVKACALNHLDIWVMRGWPGLGLEMPHWGGSDIAGVVAGLGDGVSGVQTGDRVVIDHGINPVEDEFTLKGEHSMSPRYMIIGENVRGGFARYVKAPAKNLVKMPDDVGFPKACAPLLVTLTAWRMLIGRGRLQAGETVLIVGAGGGVNSASIQIAKLAGAVVYVVASSAEKAEKALELGADFVIDRSRVNWGKEVHRLTERRGVDLVVDNVGAATLVTSMSAAARGGRIVIVGNTSGPLTEIDVRMIFGKQISLIGSTMGTPRDFRDVTRMLWSGKIRTVIDEVMPLSEGKRGFEMMEQGKLFGKVVFVP